MYGVWHASLHCTFYGHVRTKQYASKLMYLQISVDLIVVIYICGESTEKNAPEMFLTLLYRV